jgi:calcineurin-like phosphoesterase
VSEVEKVPVLEHWRVVVGRSPEMEMDRFLSQLPLKVDVALTVALCAGILTEIAGAIVSSLKSVRRVQSEVTPVAE